MFIIGRTEDDLKVVGLKISFTVVGSTLGLMEEVTMENILKTKSTDSAYMFGQIQKSTKDIGRTASNTGKENSQTLKESQESEFGKMGNVVSGCLVP